MKEKQILILKGMLMISVLSRTCYLEEYIFAYENIPDNVKIVLSIQSFGQYILLYIILLSLKILMLIANFHVGGCKEKKYRILHMYFKSGQASRLNISSLVIHL